MSNFERITNITVKIPKNEEEFYQIIELPMEELLKIGFGIWDKMSNICKENIINNQRPNIIVPIVELNKLDLENPLENPINNDLNGILEFKRPKGPIEYKCDTTILLFPSEWFDIIPEGFVTTDIWGNEEKFSKENYSSGERFGCLAYGIQK